MLFQPEAHEALADEPWSAEKARAAIASIVADAESAFDDGWAMHPLDVGDDDDPAAKFRTVYLGGAGVVDALHRLALRGFAELRRDYVPRMCESSGTSLGGRPWVDVALLEDVHRACGHQKKGDP